MRPTERVLVYSLLGLALLGAFSPLSRLIPGQTALAGIDAKPLSGGDIPAPKIAIVAAIKITDNLMDSDRFKPARNDYEAQLKKELIQPVTDKLEELQKKVKDMDEKDPQANQMKQEFFKLRNELTAKQREAAEKLERKVGEQLKECYQLVRASAGAVAEKRGFNYVVASARGDDKFEDAPVQATIREMISRPLMVFPEGTDITEEVREDLKL